MAASPVYVDPAAEINGDSIRVVLASFPNREQAHQLLQSHGLPAEPQPDAWYPLRAWLDVLADLETTCGEQAVYDAGRQVIDYSVWPPNLLTLHEALRALDAAYRANVRGGDLGHYRIEGKGLREIRVECLTPNPPAFEHGIISGLVTRFRPLGALRVRVEPEPLPADAPVALKRFEVSW